MTWPTVIPRGTTPRVPVPPASIAITGGHVVPIEGEPIDGGTVLIIDGSIAAVGGPGPQAAARRRRRGRGRPVGAARLHRRAHPPRRARGGRGLGRARHERAHRPGPGPRPGARRDQPGRRGVPRRDRRRRADRGDHPRFRQPDRRPDGGGPLLGPHGRRHGAPLPRRDEVSARREPQARPRRAPGQPVEPPRHRRRDPHRARRRAQLPGKRKRCKTSQQNGSGLLRPAT